MRLRHLLWSIVDLLPWIAVALFTAALFWLLGVEPWRGLPIPIEPR